MFLVVIRRSDTIYPARQVIFHTDSQQPKGVPMIFLRTSRQAAYRAHRQITRWQIIYIPGICVLKLIGSDCTVFASGCTAFFVYTRITHLVRCLWVQFLVGYGLQFFVRLPWDCGVQLYRSGSTALTQDEHQRLYHRVQLNLKWGEI